MKNIQELLIEEWGKAGEIFEEKIYHDFAQVNHINSIGLKHGNQMYARGMQAALENIYFQLFDAHLTHDILKIEK